MRNRVRALLIAAMLVTSVACTPAGGGTGTSSGGGQAADDPATVRLGYFPNVTHATALVGINQGIFARALGRHVTLQANAFNAGPEAIEALFGGGLDATYIGPNPAINAFARSDGKAIRIVSGATSGGAFLVVRPDIKQAADLRGRTLASPQLGNTQDVALRAWLLTQGLKADVRGGGDVSILPQANPQTLETFRAGEIDGAWVPEPWATRLIEEAGGVVLVDERDIWPAGQYVTTHLIVRTEFLEQRPDLVKGLLRGQVEATDYIADHALEAQAAVNAAIEQMTGKALPAEVLSGAWQNLTFTNDPIGASLEKSAADATSLGLLPGTELDGIYDLRLLNEVLAEKGLAAIAVP